jgi:ATP synthase protein I
MTSTDPEHEEETKKWEDRVAEKEARRLRALRHKGRSIWFGLGTFGVVGWTIVVPTLLGIFIGLWIDRTWPSQFSWTLMLFFAGLAIGCYGAWRWLYFESGLLEHEDKDRDGD